jgi:hypothetical protein
MMKIEKIFPWSAEAERGLSRTFGRDLTEIIAGVNNRSLECYRLWDGQAYAVTRVERSELTICCYQGARLVEAMRWMRAQCQRRGIRAIRFHTARPGMHRLLKEFPFGLDMWIYRMEVPQLQQVA